MASRRVSWLVLAVLLLISVLLGVVGPAQAASGSVRIDPVGVDVAPGGRVTLDLVAEPPVASLAAWVLEVAFDPSVVGTDTRECDPFDTPPGGTGAIGCAAVDANADGVNDTVKSFGAVIFSDGGGGLEGTIVLASMTFEATGSVGECTDVTITVNSFADPEGIETIPTLGNGRICIEASAPPATGEPPPKATATSGEIPPTGVLPPTGGGSAGESGSAGWLLAGVLGIGLVVLGIGAWAVARMRR